MSISLAELRRTPHTSVSQLKSYQSCPRRHSLQYIDKAEPAFRTLALSFGTAFHGSVQHHLVHSTPEQHVPRQEMYELFKNKEDGCIKVVLEP